MAIHCIILAWRIPMDRAARPAIGLQRVGHDWATAKPYSTWKTRSKFLANQIHSLVLVTQSWLTLCDPMDCSLPGSSVVGIRQERTLEWVAISPGNRPDPGIEPRSPSLPADFLLSELWEVKIHSLDLDKYTMTLIYQYSVIQSIFTALNILCAPPIHPSLPAILNNHWSFFVIYKIIVLSFPECQIIGNIQ